MNSLRKKAGSAHTFYGGRRKRAERERLELREMKGRVVGGAREELLVEAARAEEPAMNLFAAAVRQIRAAGVERAERSQACGLCLTEARCGEACGARCVDAHDVDPARFAEREAEAEGIQG